MMKTSYKIRAIIFTSFSLLLFQNCMAQKLFLVIDKKAYADEPDEIRNRRSLLIMSTGLMNELTTSRYHLASLLGEVALNELAKTANNKDAPAGGYVAGIFQRAYEEQQSNDVLPPPIRIGGQIFKTHSMNNVFKNWKVKNSTQIIKFEDLLKIKDPADLIGGPFRMLAIVNRMDLAGDMDDRANQEATQEARSLGEIHIVYGLIDENYEAEKKEAFPMTFVLSYRLPILHVQKNGDPRLSFNEDLSHTKLIDPVYKKVWKNKMQIWATLFNELSNYEQSSEIYRAKLSKILSLSVTPDNFLTIKSNSKVNNLRVANTSPANCDASLSGVSTALMNSRASSNIIGTKRIRI